jgi:outer membrane protein assembly factor BamB
MGKLRRLLVSTCMALMLPAAALAAPKVTFNVKYAPPKGVVLVTGKGFTPNASVVIKFDQVAIGQAHTNAAGAFTKAPVNIPARTTEGRHMFTVIDIAGLTGFSPFLIETDWSQQRFDPSNSAYNPSEWKLNTTTVQALAPAWNTVGRPGPCVPPFYLNFALGEASISTIVAGGVVYFNNDAAGLQALDPATGNLLWGFDSTGGWGGGNCGTPPVADNGHLVMFSDQGGTVWAVNTVTHAKAWSQAVSSVGNGYGGFGVLSVGTTLFVNTTTDNLFSLNESKAGAQNWKYQEGDSQGPPAWNGGRVFAAGYGPAPNNLMAFNASSGAQEWENDSFTGFSVPVAAGQSVYYVDQDINGVGQVSAFNSATGELQWTNPAQPPTGNNLALANGLLYVTLSYSNGLGGIAAYSTSVNGTSVWSSNLGGNIVSLSDPIVANGVVYVGTQTVLFGFYLNYVEALDASNGTVLWSYLVSNNGVGGYPPVPTAVVDGTLYVANPAAIPDTGLYQTDLYAFR